MSGLAMIGQGLSSAGYAAGDFYGKSALADQNSELELSRQQRLAEFQQKLKDAPLNRISAKAKNYAEEDVPQEGAPVTNLTGAGLTGINPDEPADSKFSGNPQEVLKGIMALPDGPDKEAALRQLQGQVKGDATLNAQAVAGQTRKRTAQEATRKALAEAQLDDLPAYAAYEERIGKPQREERKVDNLERREDNRAAASALAEDRKERTAREQMELQLKKLDLQQGSLETQNKRIDALIEHWERGDEEKAKGKAGTSERMGSIVNAMNSTIKNLDENKPQASDKAKRDEWQVQRDNAVAVRARAMAKLNTNFDDAGVPAPSPAPAPGTPAPKTPPKQPTISALPPDARKIGTAGGKDVYETPDGKRYVSQ